MFRTITTSLVLSLTASIAAAQGSVAVYDVVFDATWSATSHPGAYPFNAHFSPLVGGTHHAGISLWAPGGIASPGIENMAETGGQSPLTSEVDTAIAQGDAGVLITDGVAPSSPGTADATFTITEEFPLVSLVTMIAPSPDWFVGVHDLPLFENGQWRDDVVVELFAYDAGTDSGASFTAGDQDTSPQEPITRITTGPFVGTTPLGTFTFTRRTSTLLYGSGVNPAGSLTVRGGLPSVGQSVVVELDDPTASLATPSVPVLAFAATPTPSFPAGVVIPGLGLGPIGAPGELLIGTPVLTQVGAAWTGAPVPITIDIPNQPSLVSKSFYVQGFLVDAPNLRVGATEALELRVGP